MSNANCLTKAQQHSRERIAEAIEIIKELVPKEHKRSSMQRRRQMEKAYDVFCIHGPKLNITVPRLSTFYNEEQFLAHALSMAEQLRLLPPEPKDEMGAQQLALPFLEQS